MCISVDLPEPGGAHDRREAARREVDGDARERVDGGFALAVAAGQVGGRDDLARGVAVAGGVHRHAHRSLITVRGLDKHSTSANVPAACAGAARSAGGVCRILRPMHETSPTVFLIARPSLDAGGHAGLPARTSAGRAGSSAACRRPGGRPTRRAARRVRRSRLLSELGARPEPERDARADRPAGVLREHPALGARQRPRARELLLRAAQRLARIHPRAGQASRRLGVQPGEPALRAPQRHRLPRASGARAGPRPGALDRRAARGVPGPGRGGARHRRGGRPLPRQEGGHLGAAPAGSDRAEHRHRLDGQRAHAASRDRDAHGRGGRGGAATGLRQGRRGDARRGAWAVPGLLPAAPTDPGCPSTARSEFRGDPRTAAARGGARGRRSS